MRFLTLISIQKITFLCSSIVLFPISSFAENSQYLSIGLTQTDNLEIQADADIGLNNGTVKRSGVAIGLSFQKQSLDFSGGYVLTADFDYNKGLNDTGDISSIRASASKLTPLNSHWLMRSSMMLRHYKNEPLAVNSYDGIQLENTVGYLIDDNSGTDISLQLGRENHHQDETDRYKTTRTGLKMSHYFSHQKNDPYWVVNIGTTQNNANNDQRDFDTYSVGVESRQWALASLRGTAGILWQIDQYKKLAGARFSREDKTAVLQVNISQAIQKNVALFVSASTGRYQSSRLDTDENFYQLSSHIRWQF